MSGREPYDALSNDAGWLGAIARAGRARRAAEELAEVEYEEGWYAHSEEAAAEPLRLAADDGAARVRWTDGVSAVHIASTPTGRTATQTEGPAGATLLWGGVPVPLTTGVPAALPTGDPPPALHLIDASGRRRTLRLSD